jgi:hypothetical protein
MNSGARCGVDEADVGHAVLVHGAGGLGFVLDIDRDSAPAARVAVVDKRHVGHAQQPAVALELHADLCAAATCERECHRHGVRADQRQ